MTAHCTASPNSSASARSAITRRSRAAASTAVAVAGGQYRDPLTGPFDHRPPTVMGSEPLYVLEFLTSWAHQIHGRGRPSSQLVSRRLLAQPPQPAVSRWLRRLRSNRLETIGAGRRRVVSRRALARPPQPTKRRALLNQ